MNSSSGATQWPETQQFLYINVMSVHEKTYL